MLEEESSKRAELERWHLEQQQAIQTTEAEKQELEQQRVLKEQALQEAMAQLEQLELERKQALEQYEVVGLSPETLIIWGRGGLCTQPCRVQRKPTLALTQQNLA